MQIYKIFYDETVVGIVVDSDGKHSNAEALQAWNSANPSYAGDSAVHSDFVTL